MAKIRTRARAVDMLGRQQIATIQNAISELFKNAHDAYAEVARVDYFEDQGFMIVRDNGVGMTRHDFEDKWLVIGTESKLGDSRALHFRPIDKEPRPITGEKGIGRLAIALLGRQVLVLTRALREDGLHDLVACWLHWGLFEVPGLNLEEIELPIEIFPAGALPQKSDIAALKLRLVANIEAINKSHSDLALGHIIREVKSFSPDPAYLDLFFSEKGENYLSLVDGGHGTHFLIGPTNPVIRLELQTEERENDYSFRKQLLGFYDQVFGDKNSEIIATSFTRWLPGSLAGEEFLQTESFFTHDELINVSDTYLKGTVDEFGQFAGALRVYETQYPNLIIPWPESRGSPTCQ